MWARFARLAGIVGLSVPVVLLGLSAAARADGGEQVTSYQISVTIQPDGVTHVREVIGYDFGTDQRHGIFRYIPDRQPVSGGRDREFPVSDITVSSPDGAPSQMTVTHSDNNVVIRIGDPARTITGQRTYVLSYDIARAIIARAGHDELSWNLIGTGWAVPISHIVATVSGPGAVTAAVCDAGATGSHARCGASAVSGEQARFTQNALDPGQGMTVTVQLPAGSVRAEPPLLVSASGTLNTFRPRLLSLVLAVLVVALLWTWPQLLAAARRRREVPVVLPRGFGHSRSASGGRVIRPAEAGVVLARGVVPRHIAATVVDLAIRGYLRIEDLPPTDHDWPPEDDDQAGSNGAAGSAAHAPHDWRLTRLKRIPAGAASAPGSPGRLLPYEEVLLRELFDGRVQVRVSELHGAFWESMTRIAAALSLHVQREGWLKLKISQLRGWVISCWVTAAIGAAAVVTGLELHQPPGLAFSGVVVAAGALVALMCAPTARREGCRLTTPGMRLVAELRPLRSEVSADHSAPPSAGDPWTGFTDLLPYAIALGEAANWAKRFEGVAAPAQAQLWLESGIPWPDGLPDWYFGTFSHHICELAPPAHLTMAGSGWGASGFSVAGGYYASSGGFSGGYGGGFSGGGVGGGVGGGGGGSW